MIETDAGDSALLCAYFEGALMRVLRSESSDGSTARVRCCAATPEDTSSENATQRLSGSGKQILRGTPGNRRARTVNRDIPDLSPSGNHHGDVVSYRHFHFTCQPRITCGHRFAVEADSGSPRFQADSQMPTPAGE